MDIISRLDERSAAVAAARIERQFGAAGSSAGDAAGRGMSAAIDRSTSNIGQRVTGQFTTHGQTAGRNFGTGFTGQVGQTVGNTSGFTSALAGYQGSATQVGSLAGKALGTAFTVAAGGLIGAASLTLFKGFERYKSIDAAKNRLENLNRTLESTGRAGIDVKAVMDTVTQAVTDTPFAMDKAFSVATRALASNTGDLKRFMTVVTDAAGFAGAGVDQIGDAFLKIANTGKVSMEEIGNELRNIPILPWLQEQMGVSGAALQKMISDGKVGLNDLMKAVESHASGFAKASGDTIEGAMSNMQTSVARLGANFLGAIFGKPTEDGNQLVDVLKTLRTRIDEVGAWVTAHQGDIREFFRAGVDAGRTVLELLSNLRNLLGGNESAIKLAGAAFLAWKTSGVFSTVMDLSTKLRGNGSDLDLLPGKAEKSAKGISAAFATIVVPAIAEQLNNELNKFLKENAPDLYRANHAGQDSTGGPVDWGARLNPWSVENRQRRAAETGGSGWNIFAGPKPPDPPGQVFPGDIFAGPFAKGPGDWQSQVRPNPARRDGLPPLSLGPVGGPSGNPILGAPGLSGDGSGSGSKLPDAPVVPFDTSLPPGIPGMPADASVFGAESSFLDARQKLAEKRARVAQLEATATATEDDKLNARNEAAEAERDLQAAEMRMGEARQNQYEQLTKSTDKATKKLAGLTKDLGEVGASLDADFGISKGLAGIAENITKFVANLAAAPLLGQLSAVEKLSPTQGGHGLMGVLGAQGVFGPMYQNNQYADMISGRSGGSVAGAMGYPAAGGRIPFGPSGMAKPGESARDFAHRVMMPFWKQQGLTVGDHAADYAGEHQNGALDIMVKDLAQGQQVLQQVLSDPNVYGAIFDNKTYGYGHGLTPQDYKSGHTGNPTQDHQDHVHAWYKPGGSNNITPTRVGPASIGPPASPATVGAPSYSPASNTPALPPLTGVPSMPGGPMGSGMPQGLPVGGPLNTTQIGANVAPASGSGKGGVGMDGGGVMGMAIQAGGMALDAMAPGAGQAAQTGVKLINRAIQYGGQVAGIGAQGLMETLLPTGGSELANNNWLTRIIGGLAGAAPALPNLAGKGSEPLQPNQVDPNTTQHGQGGQPGPTFGDINVTTTRDDGAAQGRDIGYLLQTMYAAPGM
ncbi:tape measure protein [Mycolicibacterium fortuitum]|uniref:tape measure protein n=1 Tax=Mycolicibacterium fortuitum TaxID=1766 RepID=UPI001910102D|nr:tape measure protein [Mycolicibacterium fortuitum]MDV7190593.1 tape measure protein [Mycolicibacterium fortuitum]MDV7229857.1 tape measure protein [Mycolicibacterium fortuitum]MDV7257784.1 tape measure protein [Mycolicibacterium fortuitum]MDV7297221.1 tape measure protein [Mycolicibacterium fortuitum]MDV7315279.1 tape measure protein [Mycolicibacterium fortuitum]